MFNLQLTSNAQGILSRMNQMPARMALNIAAAMNQQNQLTIGHAQQNYLTGPRPGKLGVRSNRLRSSLNASKAVVQEDTISTIIGTNVKYAGVHERGFLDFVTVKAHKRNIFRTHQTGGGLVFDMATGRIKKQAKKKVSLLQGQASVSSHLRFMNMRARPFLSTSIADRAPNYSAAISSAIEAAWTEGAS